MKEDLFLMECNHFLPLQTSENLWFCDAFREIKREDWEEKG